MATTVTKSAPAGIELTPRETNSITDTRVAQLNDPSARPGEASETSEEQKLIAEPDYPQGLAFWSIMLAAGLAVMLVGLDTTIVATAVPAITDHFHTVSDIGWYSTAFRLSMCSFQFLFGKLYKIFSVKRIFLTTLTIFQLGVLLCATASSSKMFVFGRAIAGLGSAGVIAGCFTLIVQILPLRLRPLWTSVLGGAEALAIIAAPLLGGVLTEKLSWRWCFWISLPLGAITMIVVAFVLNNPQKRGGEGMAWKEKLHQLDLIGTLVFLPSLTCLFIALSWAGTKYPWTDPKILGLLVTFVVLLAIFAWDQHRKQDSATLPPRIIKRRSVIAGFIFSVCCNSAANVIEYYMPTYFQAIKEYSPAKSGYMMLPFIIGTLIGTLMQGGGTSTIGYYVPFMLLGSTLMPVAVGLMTTWSIESSFAQLVLYSGSAGFSIGIGFQAPQVGVQTSLPAADAPLGLAIILFAQNFGPALFVSIAQTIFTNQLEHNLHHLAPEMNATSIANMGLSDLKSHVSPENLGKVLLGFDHSLMQTWYLAVGLTCTTMIGSLAMEWRSVKQKKS